MTHIKIASLVALAAAVATPLAASAQNTWSGNPHYGNGRYDRDASQSVSGIIVSANRGDLTLRNGRTIFLKHGTIIDPRGESLRPGQRIMVRGFDAGNGNINAQAIQIVNDGRHDDRDRDRDREYHR